MSTRWKTWKPISISCFRSWSMIRWRLKVSIWLIEELCSEAQPHPLPFFSEKHADFKNTKSKTMQIQNQRLLLHCMTQFSRGRQLIRKLAGLESKFPVTQLSFLIVTHSSVGLLFNLRILGVFACLADRISWGHSLDQCCPIRSFQDSGSYNLGNKVTLEPKSPK